jgi:predicted RNA-binding Zn-ribbon protein involved in translation (DUF1610 family)
MRAYVSRVAPIAPVAVIFGGKEVHRFNFIKRYTRFKCPNCRENTISYLHKLRLSDYRLIHQCEKCGGKIRLPAWFTFLLVIELLVIFYVNYKLNLVGLQAILFTVSSLMFIWLVQFPFIPIKSNTRQRRAVYRANRK